MTDIVSEARLPAGAHPAEGDKKSPIVATTGVVNDSEGVTTSSITEAVEKTAEALLAEPKTIAFPRSTLKLEERYIDEPRSLRVAVVGAGLAGITAGVLLPAKVPGIQLTIFDKNADVV